MLAALPLLVVVEAGAAISTEAIAVIGLVGVAAVVAIGSALIALGTRRTPTDDREEVTTADRP